MCTSLAPASRTMRTILRLVVPRTMESSISTTRLPCEYVAHGIELELHAEVAHALFGLDEGASDVVIADQAKLQRDAALVREAHRRPSRPNPAPERRCRLRPALPAPVGDPCSSRSALHRAAEDNAVGTREIHVFEDAARLRRRRRIKARIDPFGPDHNQFAGLHVAHVYRRQLDRTRRSRRRTRWCRHGVPPVARECVPSPADGSRGDRARQRRGRGSASPAKTPLRCDAANPPWPAASPRASARRVIGFHQLETSIAAKFQPTIQVAKPRGEHASFIMKSSIYLRTTPRLKGLNYHVLLHQTVAPAK